MSAGLSSNNPFRRKGPVQPPPLSAFPSLDLPAQVASAPAPTPTLPLSRAENTHTATAPANAVPLRSAFNHHSHGSQSPSPKPIKKVRVQSPPPSSPEESTPTRFRPSSEISEGGRSHTIEPEPARDVYSTKTQSASSVDDDPFEEAEVADDFEMAVPDSGSRLPSQSIFPEAGAPPPNPFHKTLQDLENTGGTSEPDPKVPRSRPETAAARATLDVDAFRRLLLTGQANSQPPRSPSESSSSAEPSPTGREDPAPLRPNSSITHEDARPSGQDWFDPTLAPKEPSHENSRTSGEELRDNEISHDLDFSAPNKKKKPPPPSSRHGKLIRIELRDDGTTRRPSTSSSITSLRSPSNVNKPLPPAPVRRSVDGDSESIFDREAAGKVPEPELSSPTSPQSISQAFDLPQSAGSAKRPTPAPPPRRRRSEDKAVSRLPQGEPTSTPKAHVAHALASPTARDENTRPGSPTGSISSLRGDGHRLGPAPPPPRRHHGAGRPMSVYASPPIAIPPGSGIFPQASTPNFTERPSHTILTAVSDVTHGTVPDSTAQPKSVPPPRPPTRGLSTRRPPSVISLDLSNKKEKMGRESLPGVVAPRPPPPRQRGNSRSSLDNNGADGGRRSTDAVRPTVDGHIAQDDERDPAHQAAGLRDVDGALQGPSGGSSEPPAESGLAGDILADLDALQREVDALRGQYVEDPNQGRHPT